MIRQNCLDEASGTRTKWIITKSKAREYIKVSLTANPKWLELATAWRSRTSRNENSRAADHSSLRFSRYWGDIHVATSTTHDKSSKNGKGYYDPLRTSSQTRQVSGSCSLSLVRMRPLTGKEGRWSWAQDACKRDESRASKAYIGNEFRIAWFWRQSCNIMVLIPLFEFIIDCEALRYAVKSQLRLSSAVVL